MAAGPLGTERPVEARIARLEADVAHLRTDVADIKADVRSLRDKMDALRDAVAEMNTEMNAEMNNRFSGINERIANAKVWALMLYFTLAAGTFGTMARAFGWI